MRCHSGITHASVLWVCVALRSARMESWVWGVIGNVNVNGELEPHSPPLDEPSRLIAYRNISHRS